MNHIVKTGQGAVVISPREHVGLWLNACDLNILCFYIWRKRSNSLLCHKILFIDLVEFDIIEMLLVFCRADSSRGKDGNLMSQVMPKIPQYRQ